MEKDILKNKEVICELLSKIKDWPTYKCVERISSEASRLEMEWAEELGNELSPYEFTYCRRSGFIIKFIPHNIEEGKIDLSRIGIGETITLDKYWGLVRIPTLLRRNKHFPIVFDIGKSNYCKDETDYIIYFDIILELITNWFEKQEYN